MRGTKLISVRIDEDYLQKIDEYCAKHEYRNRSEVINAAIRLIATADVGDFISKACKFYPQFGDVIDTLEFKYHREHK